MSYQTSPSPHTPATTATVMEPHHTPYESGLQVVSENKPAGEGYYGTQYQSYGGAEAMQGVPEKRIMGMRKSTFILTCVVAFLLAGLVLIAGLFGSKISTLENKQSLLVTGGSPPASQGSGDSPTKTIGGSDGTPTQPIPAGTMTDISVSGYTYQGCYVDGADRVLADSQTTSNSLTNAECANFCKRFKYFGTEFGSQCYCGDSMTTEKMGNPWNCINHCNGAGASAEVCGGFFYLSLWKKN